MKEIIEEYGEIIIVFVVGLSILLGMKQGISFFKTILEMFVNGLG